jgi:RHS repeat-associated protein
MEYSNGALQHFPMSEGRVNATTSPMEYEYFMKDHLGNVRMTIKNVGDRNTKVAQEDFYYPFGMRQSIKVPGIGNKKLYNGKDLVDDFGLNWYHYGARWYDPMIARWIEMDPADEMHTPYGYVGDNPIKFIDPNGKQIYFAFNIKAGAILDIHEPVTDFTLYGNWGSLTLFGYDTRTGITAPWERETTVGSGIGLGVGAYRNDVTVKPLPLERSPFQSTSERITTNSLSYNIGEIKTKTIEHLTTTIGSSDSPDVTTISSSTSGNISKSIHFDLGIGVNFEVGIDNTRILSPVLYQTSGSGIDATSTVVRGVAPPGPSSD